MNRSLCGFCLGIGLCTLPSRAGAVPLSVVTVTAPDNFCAFEADCTVVVSSGVTNFAIPGAAGTGQLQLRTYPAKSGLPPTIKQGYEYRLDRTQATTFVDASCVTGLEIDFGAVTKLQYNKIGPLDDVFVITKGGPGTIGLASAEQNGTVITFTFAQPVCAADDSAPGKGTFFFGLASTHTPTAVSAIVEGPFDPIRVRAVGPNH